MPDTILHQFVSCKCSLCGQMFERPAQRLPMASITLSEAYNESCSVCDDCRRKALESKRRIEDDMRRKFEHAAKKARRKTAADIIQEYNLIHMKEKKHG